MTPVIANSLHRNANIDRIRGASIAVVVLLHYAMFNNLKFWPFETHWGATVAGHGLYGVTTFFVISGFLITSISLKRWADLGNIDLGAFYLMRAGRILPGLLLLILVLLILHAAGVPHFVVPGTNDIPYSIWLALTFRYHWILGPNTVEGMIGWGPIWSLSVEELFYIFFPLATIVLRSRPALVAACVILIFSGPHLRESFGFYNLPASVDALAMGCLAALISRKHQFGTKVSAALRLAGVFIGGAAYLKASTVTSLIYTPSFIEIGAALFLVGSVNGGAGASRFWPDRGLRFLGQHSYELYLFHIPVALLMKSVPFDSYGASPAVAFIIYVLAVCFLAALLSTFVVEPANRAIRSIAVRPRAALVPQPTA